MKPQRFILDLSRTRAPARGQQQRHASAADVPLLKTPQRKAAVDAINCALVNEAPSSSDAGGRELGRTARRSVGDSARACARGRWLGGQNNEVPEGIGAGGATCWARRTRTRAGGARTGLPRLALAGERVVVDDRARAAARAMSGRTRTTVRVPGLC